MAAPPRPRPVDSTPPRRHRAPVVVVVCIGLAVAVVLAVVALRAGGDDPASSPAGSTPAAGAAHVHDHAAGDALPGCDQAAMHAAMMMFNPTVADDLLIGSCPWPYDARIATAGGTEDPSIAAPYEPHRYQEVFDLLTSIRFGICNVSTLPDALESGFVFGFSVGLHPDGCASGEATVTLVVREYATRAWRDTAANAANDTVVLGRWVITLDGTDAAGVTKLRDELVGLGAA